jgi:hypothetical protein
MSLVGIELDTCLEAIDMRLLAQRALTLPISLFLSAFGQCAHAQPSLDNLEGVRTAALPASGGRDENSQAVDCLVLKKRSNDWYSVYLSAKRSGIGACYLEGVALNKGARLLFFEEDEPLEINKSAVEIVIYQGRIRFSILSDAARNYCGSKVDLRDLTFPIDASAIPAERLVGTPDRDLPALCPK